MKKILKKIISIITVMACMSALTTMNIFAETFNDNFSVPCTFEQINCISEDISTYDDIIEVSSYEITPYDNNFPTQTWNLSTKGSYPVDGWGNGNDYVYTKYRFKTDDTYIVYGFTNNHSTDLDVYYYKNGSSILNRHFLCTIPAGGYKSGKIKVSSDDYIVFAFPAPCAVEGTVL